ncbi:MAG: response regulator [Gammaproteobacteria bacterium]|nr:response regulator [Gammaproteobacteria bacterium]MBQ0838391.1 response regulator [Gammaproteobacteria bacterium]
MGEQAEQGQPDTEHLRQDFQRATENTEKNSKAVVDLYAIASKHELSLEQKILEGLAIGAECFEMPLGLITRIDGQHCHIEYVVGPEGSPGRGDKCALGSGFCGRAWAEGKTIAIEDVGEAEPGFTPDQILPSKGSYLGARISVHGSAYGTLCFSSEATNTQAFSAGDKAVVQLFAEWAGNEITTHLIRADLAAKAERMRAIVDNVIDGIITVSSTGLIESINAAVTKIFGYSAAELIGQPLQRLLTSPLDESVLLQRPDGELTSPYCEVEGLRKSGEVFPLEVAVSEMTIGGERLYTAIMRDVTERKRVENLKNQFISTVSHELRTPLTSIRGALGIVLGKESASLSPKAKKMLDTANRNSERLTLLINDILDLEKIEAGEMSFELRVVDIHALAERALLENESYAKNYQVDLHLQPTEGDAIFVLGDENRLLQVFANLLSNAIKFSPSGDRVSIDLSKSIDGRVRIAVIDKGAGIPEEFQARIFARFAQADASDTRQQGGTGLGLAVSKAIVEHHSGLIGFESKVGSGSTFYFDLPEWQDIVRADNHQDYPRALICEDNLDVAFILSTLLMDQGLVSDTATTGAAVKTLLAERDYQLMLLDLTLPDTDGISLLRDLRALPGTSTLPVIVVSANIGENADKGKNEALAVIDWLQKPIDELRLSQALLHALQGDGEYQILHVEDDLDVVQVVGEMVAGMGQYHYATTLTQARACLQEQDFDLVILDLTLPDGQGAELLDSLAGKAPVVVFSGKEPDKILAQHIDAALTKATVSNEQLVMAIRRVLNQRRPKE